MMAVDGRRTHIVEIDVYTAIVVEDKVANSVCALDGLRVVVKGFQKPGVLSCYELAGLGICPELKNPPLDQSLFLFNIISVCRRRYAHLVLVIFMQVHAAFLGLPPLLRHCIINVGLVDDLRNELRTGVDEWRIRGGYISWVDCVCRSVFDKEGEEGEDGANQEGDY